jgi:hypothetical protein
MEHQSRNTVLLVVGLPGSGKTTWAKAMIQQFSKAGYDACLVDDPRTPADLNDAISLLGSSTTAMVVVTDPHLCRTSVREKAIAFWSSHADVQWVFFENNLEQAIDNVAYRCEQGDVREVYGSIREWSKEYVIPDSCTPLPIPKARDLGSRPAEHHF